VPVVIRAVLRQALRCLLAVAVTACIATVHADGHSDGRAAETAAVMATVDLAPPAGDCGYRIPDQARDPACGDVAATAASTRLLEPRQSGDGVDRLARLGPAAGCGEAPASAARVGLTVAGLSVLRL
jgi:hypothetical protein